MRRLTPLFVLALLLMLGYLPMSAPATAAPPNVGASGTDALLPTGSSQPAARVAIDAATGEATARAHLLANATSLGVTRADVEGLRVYHTYAGRNNTARYVFLQQTVNGIGVFNGVANVTLLPDGSVLHVGNRLIANLSANANSLAPTLTQAEAIAAAANALGLAYDSRTVTQARIGGGTEREMVYSGGDLSLERIPVKLVYQPMADGSLRLAWDMNIYQRDAQHWWTVRVDALTGALLDQLDWVVSENWNPAEGTGLATVGTGNGASLATTRPFASIADGQTSAAPMAPDSYRVYAEPIESPNHTIPVPPADARTIEVNPADTTASPFGWHDTNGAAGAEFQTTQGNNAHAYTDIDFNNTPDVGSSPSGGATLDFNFPLDLTQPPSAYRPAAVTNLFYWNNIMHDVPYLYGFDEAAANFQENNYGRGGLGSDYVQAEAQDGSGTNNANFATPAEGLNPRMQMYIGTNPTPDVDGDLDNGVIAHEYGHGISNRLTGGGIATCLSNSEQMGEGWSDWQALLLTMVASDTGPEARGIGTYLFGQPVTGPGIRPAPYSTNFAVNNFTYNNRTGVAIPHGIGFLWATMLWEMNWNLIDEYGFNPDIRGAWTTGGNNLAYQLVQDGMAIQPCLPGFEDGRNAILAADVALTGGDNACLIWDAFAIRGMGFSADQGSSATVSDGVAAFDMPPSCLGPTINPSSVAICAGQVATYGITISNPPYTTTTTLSGSGNPPPTTLNFAPPSGTPPFSSTLTVNNTAAAPAGTYTLVITGTSAAYTESNTATLQIATGAPAAPTLTSPTNGAIGVGTSPTFVWAAVAGATSYTIEIATDAAFTNIIVTQSVASPTYNATNLPPGTTLHWRVRAINPCGTGQNSAAFNFTTLFQVCSPNQPIPIPDSPSTGITDTFTITQTGTIVDINILMDINHTWVGDLRANVIHGATVVTAMDRPGVPATTNGCSNNDIRATLDDEAASPVENQCAAASPTINGTFTPNNPLSAFDGQPLNGTWGLGLRDFAGTDTGTLNDWCVVYTVTGGATPTATATATNGPSPTATATATTGPSATATATATTGPSATATATATTGPSATATATATTGPTGPEINVTPAALNETHENAPEVTTQTLTIQNQGSSDLTWTISEEENAPDGPAAPAPIGPQFRDRTGAGGSEDGASLGTSDAGVSLGVGAAPAPIALAPEAPNAPQGTLSEDFDDITTLPGAGWSLQNLSAPVGVNSWFQGNDAVFPSQTGAPTAYIGANFNSTAGVGTISNWLITPVLNLENGDTLTFWTRTVTGSVFPDRLQVRMSTAGASTNVGATATSVGDFTNLLLDINPTYASDYPDEWAEFTVTVSGLGAPTTGRMAFRYFVEGGGPSGDNSNYIGIDTVDYTSDGGGAACDAPSDAPWLSVSPTNGTTTAGGSSAVTVTYNSTGLVAGTYTHNLCIASNDADEPETNVLVTLEVMRATAVTVTDLSTPTTTDLPLLAYAAGGLALLALGGTLVRRVRR